MSSPHAFLCVAFILGLFSASRAQVQPTPGPTPTVPDELKVPSGNVLSFHLVGGGYLIYDCIDGQYVFNRTLIDLYYTKADLSADVNRQVHNDYLGSIVRFTEVNVESSIFVQTIGSQDHSNLGNAPWLLYITTNTDSGSGLLSSVTYVQRINTVDGLAPAYVCDPTLGQYLSRTVADFYFYVPGSTPPTPTPNPPSSAELVINFNFKGLIPEPECCGV